jgi:Domain of unknown function (DUF4276)
MRIDFLLEEISAEAALQALVPRLLPGHECLFRSHRGWQDLLARLPGLLRGYAQRIRLAGEADRRVVVLLDADGQGLARKQQLEELAASAGLVTKTSAQPGELFHVLNRVAVDELEAWFLGDRLAIQAAYPRVHANHFKGIRNTDPKEAAAEKSSHTLHRLLQRAGAAGESKLKNTWAADIAPHLSVEANASASFCCFRDGLRALR